MVCRVCKKELENNSKICNQCGLILGKLDINEIIKDNDGPFSKFTTMDSLIEEFIIIYKSLAHEDALSDGENNEELQDLYHLCHLVLSYIMQNYQGNKLDKHIVSFFKTLEINHALKNAKKYYFYWLKKNSVTNIEVRIELARRFFDGKYGIEKNFDLAYDIVKTCLTKDIPSSYLLLALICENEYVKSKEAMSAMLLLYNELYNRLRITEQIDLLRLYTFWMHENYEFREHLSNDLPIRFLELANKVKNSNSEFIINELYYISNYLLLLDIDGQLILGNDVLQFIRDRFYSYDLVQYKYNVLFNFNRAIFFQSYVLDTKASLKYIGLVNDEMLRPTSNMGILINPSFIKTLVFKYRNKFYDYDPDDYLDYDKVEEKVEVFVA